MKPYVPALSAHLQGHILGASEDHRREPSAVVVQGPNALESNEKFSLFHVLYELFVLSAPDKILQFAAYTHRQISILCPGISYSSSVRNLFFKWSMFTVFFSPCLAPSNLTCGSHRTPVQWCLCFSLPFPVFPAFSKKID